MRQLVTVALVLLFCKSLAAQAQAHDVKIYTNGYKGWITTTSATGPLFLHRDTTLTINPDREGNYYLNTGATKGDGNDIQTSYIYFSFNAAGELTNVLPTSSASLQGKGSITLHTASITIDPGRFTREWYPSFGTDKPAPTGFYYGKKRLRLIVGQTYNIDNAHSSLVSDCSCDPTKNPCQPKYNTYYGSYFYFTVLSNGRVKLYDDNLKSAKACGQKLTFRTVMVMIDPAEISGGVPLSIPKPSSPPWLIAKKTRLPFIRGTVNHVDWTSSTAKNMTFQFLPM